jgi:hypothetical protein
MVGIEGTKTSESVAVIGATYKVEMKPLAQLIRQQSSAVINMPAVVGN